MSRSSARESVFKLVYSYLFNKEKDDFMLQEFCKEAKEDSGYISEVYNGVINNFEQLSNEIKNVSVVFKIDRIFNVKSVDDYISRTDEMIARKAAAYPV